MTMPGKYHRDQRERKHIEGWVSRRQQMHTIASGCWLFAPWAIVRCLDAPIPVNPD